MFKRNGNVIIPMSLHIIALIMSTSTNPGNFKVVNVTWNHNMKLWDFLSDAKVTSSANMIMVCCLQYI